jgi:hypothetical protein
VTWTGSPLPRDTTPCTLIAIPWLLFCR